MTILAQCERLTNAKSLAQIARKREGKRTKLAQTQCKPSSVLADSESRMTGFDDLVEADGEIVKLTQLPEDMVVVSV